MDEKQKRKFKTFQRKVRKRYPKKDSKKHRWVILYIKWNRYSSR